MTQKNFLVQRVFLKDLSFESPMGAKAFTQSGASDINVDVNTLQSPLDEQHMEVSLRITITASQEETVVFIAEVDYAGVFVAEGFDENEMEHIVKVHCPTILFPYVRETLDGIIVKGNFPPLLLAPLNFEGIYRDAQSDASDGETAH